MLAGQPWALLNSHRPRVNIAILRPALHRQLSAHNLELPQRLYRVIGRLLIELTFYDVTRVAQVASVL